MTINDFYKPLNPLNLLILFSLLVVFDAIGVIVNRHLIKAPKEYRILYWLFGMAPFVLLSFLLGFFILPVARNILITLAIVCVIFLPRYLQNFRTRNFLRFLLEIIPPLLMIAPILPAIWIKSSLPSYQWDELSYHYTSPWGYNHIHLNKLTDGFYENIPKTYDVLYSLIFNLTKTYSIARAFHFITFFSTMTFVYQWLKKNSGIIPAVVFFLVSFYIPGDIITNATSGYVDIAANSFIFLAILATLGVMQNKLALTVPSAFWALALGTRYNSMIPLLSYSILFVIFYIFSKQYKKLTAKVILSVLLVLILFGGFWYIKNLILTGNPIFPFYLPCYRFAKTCEEMKSYFGGWTYAVNRENLPMIIYYVLSGSKAMAVSLGIGIFLITQLKNRSKFVPWFILTGLAMNFVVIKYLSGYLPRYFIYIQTLCFFLIATALGKSDFVFGKVKIIKYLLTIAIVAFLIKQVPRSTMRFYGIDKLDPHEINFALGKENVYDFTAFIFPRTAHIIRWCDRPEITSEIPITFYDPDITWFRYEGRFNAFLHKCAIVPTPTTINDGDLAVKQLLEEKKKVNLVTLSPCRTGPFEKWHPTETDYAFSLRYLNNKIICNSQPTEIPYLYIFDWEKVQPQNVN